MPDTPATGESEAEPSSAPAAKPARKYDRSIVEGPLRAAIWKLAWPTMLTNVFGGLQVLIDHILVGHFLGYAGNAAIGVANQLIIMVISFIMSVFTGMSVLVARFVGAGDAIGADRAVYQAFITALAISLGVMAPVGYFAAPAMLEFVNATGAVHDEALPFLRISFIFSAGMLLFYMIGGALRSAGDARTPMVLGVVLTILNIAFNVVLIPGAGPIPAMGTAGSALGTAAASLLVGGSGMWRLWHGG